MKTVIKNGTVVSGSCVRQADILLEGEKIVQVQPEIICKEAEVIDAFGYYVFPGFIDAHTHFDLEVAGTRTADDFYTGTKAAIAGGTTCILDFATQYKGETLQEALQNWHKKADRVSSCDYGFHLAISDWNPAISKELSEITQQGVSSFKVYMTYDTMVNDAELYQILKRMKQLHAVLGVHCENDGIIKARIQEEREQGNLSPAAHPISRPALAEAEAVNRLLLIAELVDVPVVIVHLSTKEAYDVVKQARNRGQKVYVESCPQYLLLEDSVYTQSPEESRKFVCAPPIREKESCEVLWNAVKKNAIDTISTDHCSFTTLQKAAGKHDFSKIPNGMPGVETRPALLYTYGVCTGKISLEQMCALLAENPAKLYQMYPQKGTIAPGSDADLVLWNPDKKKKLTATQLYTNTDYCPFEGWELQGAAETVFLRGSKIFEQGRFLQECRGQYLRRTVHSYNIS